MQRTLGLALVIVAFSWSARAQAKPATTAPPHRAAAKPTPVDENAPDPIAIIDTTVGKMTCTLYPKKAPIGVANFIGLATGTKDWTNPTTHKKMHGVPLYDGTIFHRVIPNFMIQGGDAQGDGRGEPGYNFQNETSPDLTFDRPGRLAYANRGPDTNGSQFFITEIPYTSLNGGYTIFGQCDDASVALVKQIARVASDPSNNRPLRPVTINHISIVKAGGPATAAAPKSAAKKPATGAKATTAPTSPPK